MPDDTPDLTRSLHQAIRDPHPLALLDTASMLAEATASDPMAELRARMTGKPGRRSAASRSTLVDAFRDVGERETDALLLVWAEMLTDEVDSDGIRSEVRARRHPLPRWLHHLDEVRPTRAMRNSHVLGDGDNIFIGVETPGRSFTIVLYIDHNMGTIPKDGYTIDRPVSDLIAFTAQQNVADTELTELLLEDARALIEQALENESHLLEPIQNDSWPGARPLLKWMLRLMPSGGTGYGRREWSDDEIRALVREFTSSSFAEGGDADTADRADALLHFASNYRDGDPLRWSNVVAEIMLLDLFPRRVHADAKYLKGVPDTLRRVIRFAHAKRGIPAAYTQEAIAAVTRFEPEYLRLTADRTSHSFFDDLADSGISTDEFFLRQAAAEVGGIAELDALDATPLPLEPLDVSPMPQEAREAAQRIDAVLERVCTGYFDNVELLTATRRMLTKLVATAAEKVAFGTPENAASAICFIVGHANAAFVRVRGGHTIKGMTRFIGVKSTPNDRASSMLGALGVNYYDWEETHALGDARLLTSATRAKLIKRRELLRESMRDS